jgi:hypothetical protein
MTLLAADWAPVGAHFQAHAAHPDRVADAFLGVVDDVFLGDGVQDLLVGRHGDGLGRLEHAVEVGIGHFAARHRHDTGRVAALGVAAGNGGVDRADLAAGHQLGFFHRALDRLHGGFDVHHHAALHASRFMRTDADHFDFLAGRILAHQRGDLGGADVESDDQRLVAFAIHVLACVADAGGVAGGAGASCQTRVKPLV